MRFLRFRKVMKLSRRMRSNYYSVILNGAKRNEESRDGLQTRNSLQAITGFFAALRMTHLLLLR